MSDLPFPGWQQMYLNSFTEVDVAKRARMIKETESVLTARLNELRVYMTECAEMEALMDALNGLKAIRANAKPASAK